MNRVEEYYESHNLLPFLTSFIEAVNYHGSTVTLDLDRSTPLSGDNAGLFPGVVHEWDALTERLSLNFSLDTDFFSFRLYADDLSFSDESDDAVIFSGNVLSFTLSRAWPVQIAFELFSAVRYNDINSTSLYPSIFFNLPIISLEDISFGLRFGLLKAIDNFEFSSFLDSGTSFFFYVPLRIEDDEVRLGLYLQRDGVYYNLYNDNFSQEGDEPSFAIFLDTDLNFEHFGLNINSFINFSSSTLAIIEENSYFDASLSFSLGKLDFILGARKQDLFTFNDFIDTSDFYLGLGIDTDGINTRMLVRYRNGQPEIGFSSSLAFFDVESVQNGYTEESSIPLDFKISLGYENYYGHGLYFSIIPTLSFFSDSFSLAFRVPLYLEIGERKLSPISLKADPWFDMWQENSTLSDIYDSITDMFSLIEGISIGGKDESVFFIDASRNYRRNDIFFENYASFDALSLNLGFNFYNLDFGIYVDDLEAIKIMDPYVSFFPFSYLGGSMSISIPTELKIEGQGDFSLHSFIGLTYHQPFLEQRLSLSFFLYGEMFADYADGSPVSTGVIYDFENSELYGYLLGGEAEWNDGHFSISLNAGIHSGMVYPNYFNSFTSLNPDMDRRGYDIEGLSYYAIFDCSFSYENFSFLFKYSVPNIVSLIEDRKGYEGDMLTLDMAFMLPNGFGFHFAVSRNNFASTAEDIIDFSDYINSENTIYAASIIKEFEDLTLEVELGTVAIYEEGQFINSYRLSAVAPRLKVNAKVGF